jgi:uncharacterized protein YbjQ (UPF0145 family)
MTKSVRIIKVVSKNFVLDWWAKVQNIFGYNLTPYEDMINKAMAQIEEEIKEKKYTMVWYRYEMAQMLNGAVIITFYGESK